MRSSVTRSSQQPSGGRLAGPRRSELEEHLQAGGGQGLRVATAMAGARVNGILTASGLRDRVDPDRLLGTIWAGVAAAEGADTGGRLLVEAGGPGIEGLRDRSLIDLNPYAFIEGVCIALHATGLAYADIELAGEDAGSERRLRRALEEVVDPGWPVQRIGLVVADGREAGLRVDAESIAHVAWIMTHGVRAFRSLGTAASPGTTLCTVVGDVAAPGVFEVPFGLPIRTLVRDVARGGDVKLVHRGIAFPVLTPDDLDDPLCFEAAPGGLGSGVFHAHDASRNVVDIVWSLLHDQPPSRCRDCAIARVEMGESLRRCRYGQADMSDLEALLWRAQSIADDHRCAQPRHAYVGVWSTVAAFIEEFVATIEAGEPTPGSLSAVPWSASDTVPAIEPRWCDSPRLGPSVLVTGSSERLSTYAVR